MPILRAQQAPSVPDDHRSNGAALARRWLLVALAFGAAVAACSNDPAELFSASADDTERTEPTLGVSDPDSDDTIRTETSGTDAGGAAGETAQLATDGPVDLKGLAASVEHTSASDSGPSTPVQVAISGAVEIDSSHRLPYLIDIEQDSVTMVWDVTNETFVDRAGVMPPGATDVYTITFAQPVLTGVTALADPGAPLVPAVEVRDDRTLIIAITEGMTVGGGQDAVISLSRG